MRCQELLTDPFLASHVKPVEVRQPIVLFQFQHRHRNRQIKAGPFLADIGRCQIDGDPLPIRPAQPAVVNGGGDSIFAFFNRGVRQALCRSTRQGIFNCGLDRILTYRVLHSWVAVCAVKNC
jgi:hypothetical protein